MRPIVDGRWLDGYDRDEILRRIQCPVLLLQADEAAGGMLPDDDALEVAGLVRDCTHVRLPGIGHLAHWTHTETVVRLVLGFLESLPAAAHKPERPRPHIKKALA
jgi:pimeloyl-ACP methyl ester carboxylesterase